MSVIPEGDGKGGAVALHHLSGAIAKNIQRRMSDAIREAPLRTASHRILVAVSGQAYGQVVVTIDHKTGVQNPEGLIQVAGGQSFVIRVLNTVPECFDYNFEGVLPPKTQEGMVARKVPQPLKEQNVDFNINQTTTVRILQNHHNS